MRGQHTDQAEHRGWFKKRGWRRSGEWSRRGMRRWINSREGNESPKEKEKEGGEGALINKAVGKNSEPPDCSLKELNVHILQPI